MYNFQQKKKIRKLLTSRGAFFVLLIITIFLVRGAVGVYMKGKESKQALAKVSQSLIEVKSREEELAGSIAEMKTPQGVEREIRGKFNVAREGEEVIMIVDEKTSPENGLEVRKTLYGRFVDWIKGF